ncbi:MAG: helix-turn-helix domain-containing protein [Lachnospiraceae bacterium]|jgi:excisionase family DNA binding protein|nr:helix-turn-helix domain-containing protein [Lachnospiraceae bacterium]
MNELKQITPVMLSIQEAADTFGISAYFVRKLVLSKKVKAVRSGAKYLIAKENLADYLLNGDDVGEAVRSV